MRCYRFYKKPTLSKEETPERVSLSDKYPLYGLTCKKKIAKRFMEERDMDKFIIRKSNVDRETYSELANRNRSAVLEEFDLLTCVNKYKQNQSMEKVNLILTYGEIQTIDEPQLYILDESWWNTYYMNSPFIFKEEYVKALQKIDFIDFYKLFSTDPNLYGVYDDYSVPNYYVDELSFFLAIYGELMKS